MPIFKANGELCYFAHVPKCGGTSVERYLQTRFGAVGFLDTHHSRRGNRPRWSRTSPQHIDWESLQRILPGSMIAHVFTIVRHPVARVVSSYNFQIHVEKTADPGTSFSDWFKAKLEAFETDPFLIDNHFRPQSDFMPETAAVFHLEHGLDSIVPYLDTLAGDARGPRRVGHVNEKKTSHLSGRDGSASSRPSADDVALIAEFYARDFARFGYVPDDKRPLAGPSASAEAAMRRTQSGLFDRLKRGLRMS